MPPNLPNKPANTLHPKLDAFLTRVMLRVFNDAAVLTSYYDTSGVLPDGKSAMIVFYELPKEVLPAIRLAFGCENVKLFKFGQEQQIKLAYIITPTKQEMSDLELYPSSEENDPKPDGELPDPA